LSHRLVGCKRRLGGGVVQELPNNRFGTDSISHRVDTTEVIGHTTVSGVQSLVQAMAHHMAKVTRQAVAPTSGVGKCVRVGALEMIHEQSGEKGGTAVA
jgi:hypothetical protein